MKFLTAIHTDIGIKKKTNQDSILLMEAETDIGNVLFTVVCDGMGGLEKGEVASATVIREYENWFKNVFPEVLYSGITETFIRESIEKVIFDMNVKISSYGKKVGINLGTTVLVLLIVNNIYYCINVGDTRCYKIDTSFNQLTKDQTYVQREVDMGRLTLEQAKNHPQRNVLLQCVGASEEIKPDFYTSEVNSNDMFMLCTDGFRHVITEEEFFEYMNPDILHNQEKMEETIKYFTDLNKYRKEEDNISVVLIKTE
ncbi:MAG: serine/threonine-protein phosphatase [Lachnospiraceae bacterium]|nr:serine/threonine-protein phosphatase [Lachnospiraceae bacterium]